ncbi:hypothetical protein QVD17_05259 [Tagetes erecta]|uniref:Uncharacterized protein n=1 Tax=Tagetes erecta TaxID=13708 RepID=A0AAD8PBC4_TARER|nr:hypothetical protein QVD17_05259 [Tagetes erecta]
MKHTSLTHDLAITQKYAIICDIQIQFCPINLIRGKRLVHVDTQKVPRIGVLPRYATGESNIRWFEVPGFNIFHTVNAWDETDEEGGEVEVLVAPNILSIQHFFERVDQIHGESEDSFGNWTVSEERPLESRLMRVSGVVKLDIEASEGNEDQNECTMACMPDV